MHERTLDALIIFLWSLLEGSHLPMQWQLYGVVIAGMVTTYGLYWILVNHRERDKKQ